VGFNLRWVMRQTIDKHEGNKYVRMVWGVKGGLMGVDPKLNRIGVQVDVYAILDAYPTGNDAISHAVKKLLMPGQRGKGTRIDDLVGAIAAIQRAIELEEIRERSGEPPATLPMTEFKEVKDPVAEAWRGHLGAYQVRAAMFDEAEAAKVRREDESPLDPDDPNHPVYDRLTKDRVEVRDDPEADYGYDLDEGHSRNPMPDPAGGGVVESPRDVPPRPPLHHTGGVLTRLFDGTSPRPRFEEGTGMFIHSGEYAAPDPGRTDVFARTVTFTSDDYPGKE
jgi:hypothetical protein